VPAARSWSPPSRRPPPHRWHPPWHRRAAVVDVIYDPYPTDLLAAARAAGRPAADGLLMLAGQGVEQFRLFTGATTSTSAMYSLLKGHLGLG
jgi:shikimate dehydrogenase